MFKKIVYFFAFFPLMLSAESFQERKFLYDRLDSMERQIEMLQKNAYLGKGGSAPSTSNAYVSSSSRANLEGQITELQNKLQTANIVIEELQSEVKNLRNQINQITTLYEAQLQSIEDRLHKIDNYIVNNSINSTAAEEKDESKPSVSEEKANQEKVDNINEQADEADSSSSGVGEKIIAPGSMQEEYDKALSILQNGKYKEAGQAFANFIQKYQNAPLVGNAYYWYGESYYALHQYDKASVQFLRGYKLFPEGEKAAESLLRLAMSLGKINKKKEACSSLVRADMQYGDKMSIDVKSKIKEQYFSLGCEK